MNRRAFLAAATAVAVGCKKKASTSTPVPAADAERIGIGREERERHLRELERFRVPPDAARTTAPPPDDVLAVVPELKGLTKVAVRLHPRFSDEPAADRSKLGGRFWWPAAEPWPVCDEHEIPYVPVLQLRAEDAPPNWPFLNDVDLFQLLWCPRDHGPGWVKPTVVWRKRAAVSEPLAESPATNRAFLDYVTVPCRLFPERVAEFPNVESLPASVREKLGAKWGSTERYACLLSVAGGTKVGGYPLWGHDPDPVTCPTCKWGMDYLLTVAGEEWDGGNWPRWMPLEERGVRDGSARAERGYCAASGLRFGNGLAVHLFACRRCDGWPVKIIRG